MVRARLPASTFALTVKEELCTLPTSRAELHGLIRAAGSLVIGSGRRFPAQRARAERLPAAAARSGPPALEANPSASPEPPVPPAGPAAGPAAGGVQAVAAGGSSPGRGAGQGPGGTGPLPPLPPGRAPGSRQPGAPDPASPIAAPRLPAPSPLACEIRCARAVVARRAYRLFREVTGTRPVLLVRRSSGTADGRFVCRLAGAAPALHDLGLLPGAGRRAQAIPAALRRPSQAPALLRGFFLGAGSVDDPARDHHLEFEVDAAQREVATGLLAALAALGVRGRSAARRGRIVVYLKDAAAIAVLLGAMGAGSALLVYEEQRIRKQVRGDVNRLVNAETANLSKAAAAGVVQARSARALRDAGLLETLPSGLREVALLRLHHPEASLREIGALLHPPLGKSGVQHRLEVIRRLAHGRG